MKALSVKGLFFGYNRHRRYFVVVSAFAIALTIPSAASADPGQGGDLGSFNVASINALPATNAASTLAEELSALAPGSTAWGTSSLSAKTLVLYDVSGPWGWLGQVNAEAIGNLATHSGMVVAQPVADYQPGEISNFTDVIYVGTTYNEPIPSSFINDVQTTSTKVLWLGDNAWELDNSSAAATTSFENQYGWDPSTSYIDQDNVATVTYKGTNLTRNLLAGGIVAPNITNPSLVTTLATANCTDSSGTATPCQSQARVNGATSFPWAISSSNITYVGEDPISYMNETDRYLILADLIEGITEPSASSHIAMVRLEDVNVFDPPSTLLAIGQYFHSQKIPFSVNVIPNYMDPLGIYNQGVPVNVPLTSPQAATFVQTLKQLKQLGGTLVMEGLTHQYSNVPNPYDAVSGDDFEFYRAQCSSTSSAPYSFDYPCPNSDYVIEEGPIPGDSYSFATNEIKTGLGEFKTVGLGRPQFFVAPHYAASSVDYQAFSRFFGSSQYTAAYDRRLYFGGQLTGPSAVNYSEVMGQFFPYSVHDLYGSTVVPENLGQYEPTALNNHTTRSVQDIINEAADNLVVRDGVASFFYDPNFGVTTLSQIVSGIQGLGYQFVKPKTLLGEISGTTYGNTSSGTTTSVNVLSQGTGDARFTNGNSSYGIFADRKSGN